MISSFCGLLHTKTCPCRCSNISPYYHFRLEDGRHIFGASYHDGAATTNSYTIAYELLVASKFTGNFPCAKFHVPDMPNDTDYPYPIRILTVFKVIRPYSIFIRILAKFTDTLFLAILCPCRCHTTTAQWNNRLLLVTK